MARSRVVRVLAAAVMTAGVLAATVAAAPQAAAATGRPARAASVALAARPQQGAQSQASDASLAKQAASAAERAAASAARRVPRRLRAYRWAVHNGAGCPYVWGGTGPCRNGFDCSGLVMEAFRHAGIRLPRTADEIMRSGLVRPVRRPRKGDIVFFVSGGVAYHVAFWVHRHWTFDAQQPGTDVWWHRQDSMPAAYRVV